MCYGPGASPPLPPVSGGAPASGEHITLTSGDGTAFIAFADTAPGDGPTGIVILPDVRGLHRFYEELALRFADTGIHAVAIDYFGRTVGTEPRGDDFEFMPHVQQLIPKNVAADAHAAIAHLRNETAAQSIFTIGFCMGGRASFNQAQEEGLAGVIGFYGRVEPRDPADKEAPVLLAREYRCPVLGLFGGADKMIPAAGIENFRAALDAAGVDNELHTYPGAPHSFFDRSSSDFRDECDDAWRRILGFIKRFGSL